MNTMIYKFAESDVKLNTKDETKTAKIKNPLKVITFINYVGCFFGLIFKLNYCTENLTRNDEFVVLRVL